MTFRNFTEKCQANIFAFKNTWVAKGITLYVSQMFAFLP